MSAPRVSFILPVYNGGKYLRETLDSLLTQTFGDFEIVAVNDGSTDATGEILRAERDKRVRIVERENRGLVASLNEGIEAASGEYLARIDADDICIPERLATQVAFLDDHAKVGVVGSAIETFGNGAPQVVSYPEQPGATMLFRSAMAHPSVMIRRESLGDMRYREPYRCAQDYDLWCRCIVGGVEIVNMAEPLIRYRLHPGQITQALAGPTQIEGEAIRREFVKALVSHATEDDLQLHNAIARHQLVATQDFVARAAAWLSGLSDWSTVFFYLHPESVMQVLTGRFVAISRFAQANGLAIPEPGAFAKYIRPGALN